MSIFYHFTPESDMDINLSIDVFIMYTNQSKHIDKMAGIHE